MVSGLLGGAGGLNSTKAQDEFYGKNTSESEQRSRRGDNVSIRSKSMSADVMNCTPIHRGPRMPQVLTSRLIFQ